MVASSLGETRSEEGQRGVEGEAFRPVRYRRAVAGGEVDSYGALWRGREGLGGGVGYGGERRALAYLLVVFQRAGLATGAAGGGVGDFG